MTQVLRDPAPPASGAGARLSSSTISRSACSWDPGTSAWTRLLILAMCSSTGSQSSAPPASPPMIGLQEGNPASRQLSPAAFTRTYGLEITGSPFSFAGVYSCGF